MTWILGFAWIAFMFIAPIWAIAAVRRQRRELQALRGRIDALEERLARGGEPLAVVPAPATPFEERLPEPIPLTVAAPVAPVAEFTPPVAVPARAPSPAFDGSRAEELIGSVWLQNVGAVLLPLGVFFLILWGYTTGRLGPGVLVWAGVALGAALGWRGDRMARSLPPFGHALIGVGLGTVYLSLYLGHFTLRALPGPLAFALLTLVSIGSVALGLRYRVQSIAALGLLGAFVPQIMAAWVPLRGFSMTVPGMLGYLAATDAVVFLLAARAGWSGIGLAALLLSAITWLAQFGDASWGWGVQAALAGLFVSLGLSPLPRLARSEAAVRGIDLAAIAAAPFCLVAASWPLLASGSPIRAAMFLAALAIVYLAAALWVDARRAERDLWRPLTGAAVVFLSAALERAVGREHTPLAWCVEGALLAWLGLGPRGMWLRLCGYAVTGLGAVWLAATLFSPGPWSPGMVPGVYAAGLRELLCVLAVLAGAGLLHRGRAHLTVEERGIPELWTALGNLLLMIWTGREAMHLAEAMHLPDALIGQGGRWTHAPAIVAPQGGQRRSVLAAVLVGAVWLVQSACLVRMGLPGRGFLRACGYVVGCLGAVAVLVSQALPDGWSNDQPPFVHPAGILSLWSILVIAVVAAGLGGRRSELASGERRMPEAWATVASMLMLGWIALEAGHLARTLAGIPGVWAQPRGVESREQLMRVRVLAASFTSGGWLIQALVLLTLGWIRRSAFLRWAGLGLAGITVLKFLVVDLQTVDVFWRFLTAIVVGAALLGVSYAYQRRARRARLG